VDFSGANVRNCAENGENGVPNVTPGRGFASDRRNESSRPLCQTNKPRFSAEITINKGAVFIFQECALLQNKRSDVFAQAQDFSDFLLGFLFEPTGRGRLHQLVASSFTIFRRFCPNCKDLKLVARYEVE
jgi:hypothetical protein